jgi:glycosyltransferase involved in cell wall biosynthesis
MHVLIVDHVASLGGAEFSLEALVDRMPAGRCRYTVALPGPGPFADRLRQKHVAVMQVRHESWRWWARTRKQKIKFFITMPLQASSLVRWLFFLKRLRPDIVHCNLSRLVEPLVAAYMLHIPIVLHFRDIPSRQRGHFTLGHRSFYGLMNLADAWVANSTATAADIRPYCRRPLFVIPNGLDLARFDRDRVEARAQAEALLLPARHHVAMIANIVPWKRYEDFVELAARASRSRRDTAFYLVGNEVDREYAAGLRSTLEKAGLSAHVRFLGQIDCIPAFIGKLDVMVHTTPHEPFGRVFLEGMAGERPIVATASGGAAEIIVDGVTGVLVPQGALDQMAAALNGLLDDETRRRALGVAGRRRVEANYTIERHCEAAAALYDELLQIRRQRRPSESPGRHQATSQAG